ncbi:DoxX family protein [Massilia sp. S19_KUP03_FR1]|uniref:DoxX family protein n=1 Tax=Massilia sp. S19_KUP03_FR1 TaxID=3025503 RepID=UPI002FCD779B
MTPTIPTTRPASATAAGLVSRLCLLLLCSAYLQGGIDKVRDLPGAVAEMQHFGLAPALPFALLTIAGEIGASILVVAGIKRWLGAAYLGLFTLMATMLANRFWELAGAARIALENGFFEHLGLAGAFFLVAWVDYHAPALRRPT